MRSIVFVKIRVITMGYSHNVFKHAFISFFALFLVFFSNSVVANQKILVWGDSLSAAYGIPVEKGWVNLMQETLGEKVKIINGSISGETTKGGLTRLPAALKIHRPNIVILELGANDGLRGIPPHVTKSNLKNMIELAQTAQAKVMLLGMKIPPNYGEVYSRKFESQFVELADSYQLPFIPFFLEDVIEKLELLQEDELHPTAEAQPILLEKVLPTLSSKLL